MTASTAQYQFSIRDTITAIVDEYARRHKPASGQLGLFEKPEERQKPLFSKRVDDEEGRWVTMRGARVYISSDDGRIMKGPKALMGKTKEQIERESAGKEGADAEKAPKPKPLAEMGRISGGRADNRQKKLFEELNPGFKFEDDEDEDFGVVEPVGPAVPMAETPPSPAEELTRSEWDQKVRDDIRSIMGDADYENADIDRLDGTDAIDRAFGFAHDSNRNYGNKIWALNEKWIDSMPENSAEDFTADPEDNQETETRNISLSSLMEDASDEMEDTKPANVAWWKKEIQTKGVENVEPARVGLTGEGKMTVINGRHRMKAAMELGLDEFPAVVDVGGESFELDSSPQPSPSTSKPEDFGKSDSTKQGALFDTGKGDLPGQELLFNSDAGDLNNPKTMENRVSDKSKRSEPWQMSRSEYADSQRLSEPSKKEIEDKKKELDLQVSTMRISPDQANSSMKSFMNRHKGDDSIANFYHKKFVEKAIEKGQPVPVEVLADYPDLAKPKPESSPPPAKKKSAEKPSASSIQSHLDNDDHESAFDAFSKLKKDEVDKVAREVLGIGFYNKSKAQMLESLKRTLPLATKTASEAAQKKEEIDYAEMKLRKAKENQQAHSEDRLGAPIRSGVPEIAYTDPHGEGRAEVAKAWQAEVDDAQRELDRVRGVKAKPESPKEIHSIAKKVGLKTQNQITKKGMGTLVSNIDNGVKTMKEAVKPIATRIFDGIKNHGPNEVAENLLRHTLISGNAEIAFDRAIEEFSKKSSHEGNPLDLNIRDERKLFADEMKKNKKEILAAFRRPPESPDKYSREQLLQTMNGVIDRYIRPESEVVQVDKYAHPLIHAAVGAGAMALAGKVFKSGPLRSVAHAAIGAAMAAWMQSAMAANGIQPAQAPSSPAANVATVSPPASQFQKQQMGNAAVNQIVQNAINQNAAKAQAAATAPPSPAQVSAHSISAAAAGKAGVPGVRPLTGANAAGIPGRVQVVNPANQNQSQTAGKEGATTGKLPVTEPAGGSGSFNADHPRHPAGASEGRGGEFAPKGEEESGSSAPESPSSPADNSESGTPSPRNYPDNLNKPASEQTDYSPPERSIEPTEPPKIDKPIHTGERQSRKAAWEKHLQGMAQQVTEKKDAAKAEKKQAKELAKATSFNPAELSSPMADDVEPVGEAPKEDDFDSAKDYENALEKHNRSKGAKQATIKKRANADLIPEIAGQYDLDHSTLQQAVDEEIQMLLPYHERREEARQYISKMGWNARRINQAEDRGIDSSSTKFDDVASQWAGMFPEIAGSDESEWVARMWDLSKEGAQDPPSASDEELVNRVAKRLADSGASFSPADEEGFEYADPGPVSGQPGDVDYTPFHRKSVVDLIVDRYMRLAGIA